jgi:hypothetical protein
MACSPEFAPVNGTPNHACAAQLVSSLSPLLLSLGVLPGLHRAAISQAESLQCTVSGLCAKTKLSWLITVSLLLQQTDVILHQCL